MPVQHLFLSLSVPPGLPPAAEGNCCTVRLLQAALSCAPLAGIHPIQLSWNNWLSNRRSELFLQRCRPSSYPSSLSSLFPLSPFSEELVKTFAAPPVPLPERMNSFLLLCLPRLVSSHTKGSWTDKPQKCTALRADPARLEPSV